MNDEFDDELRRSLRGQADRIPRRPDLSASAISRARGIRRRRQVAGVVAATALVAIAVPIGLRVGDMVSNGNEPVAPATTGPTVPETVPPPTTATGTYEPPETAATDTGPTNPGDNEVDGPSGPVSVPLDLRELSEGDAPVMPYLDGNTVVGDGWSVEVASDTTAVAPVVDGAYVTGGWDNGWPLTSYAADGGSEDLGIVQGLPVASTDGRWVAYVTGETDQFGNPTGAATLVLVDTDSGDPSSVEIAGAVASELDVHAIVDGTVYFTYDTRGGRRVPLQTWSSGDSSPQRVPGHLDATAVSSEGTLVARLTSISDSELCSAIISLSSGDETPEQCGTYFTIKGFSPDGRYAWGDNSEGYAATEITVVDTQTGEVIRRYSSASNQHGVSFMEAGFEDSDSLLIRAEQDSGTALVRCEVLTGDCETAEPLVDGTSESGSPFLLPSTG
jgi:hypothetical protein